MTATQTRPPAGPPTNREVASVLAQLGRLSRLAPDYNAQRLACMIRKAELLERVAAAGGSVLDQETALLARQYVDDLCVESDLWDHLDAARIIDSIAAAAP